MSNTFERRRETILLYQGEDEARLRTLAEEVEAAQKREKSNAPRTLDEASAPVEAQAAYDQAKVEADARGVKVTVEALRRKQWRSLVKEHPPREGDQADAGFGINLDSFPEAIVPISIVEPKFDTPADREDWLEDLSDAQYDQIFWAAFRANRGTFDAPKASTGSPSSTATAE